jgi:hypothetical protein
MEKRILDSATPSQTSNENWLDLEGIARVEVSSEDPAFPVETVFSLPPGAGWRAGATGLQVVRLVFQSPVHLRRIFLRFKEPEQSRTQEFTLRWQAAGNSALHEILRQQWNFNPDGSTEETEDVRVDLPSVAALELSIQPGQSEHARASLAEWRLA